MRLALLSGLLFLVLATACAAPVAPATPAAPTNRPPAATLPPPITASPVVIAATTTATSAPSATALPSSTPKPTQTASPTPFSLKNIDRKDFPMTGTVVPVLAAFDDAMWTYMQSHDVLAGTLTIMRNGKIVLSRGYGWIDSSRTRPLPPDALFRAVGPTSTITALAVKQLIQKGKLAPDTKLLALLQLAPVPGPTPDPQLDQITVQQALDSISVPLNQTTPGADLVTGRQPDIMHALGLAGPPTSADIARYAISNSMNFVEQGAHGSERLSYLFLGLAIEKVTGQSYFDYVQKNVLAPNGVTDVQLAHTLPGQRDPREPWYSDSSVCDNVMSATPVKVPCADGGFDIEQLDSTVGLLISGPAATNLMAKYTYRGDAIAAGRGVDSWYIGPLAGTTTVQRWRRDGDLDMVVLLNQKVKETDRADETQPTLVTVLDDAMGKVKNWP